MSQINSPDKKHAAMLNAIVSDTGLYSELMAFFSDMQTSHQDQLHALSEKALYEPSSAPYALRQAGAVMVLEELKDMLFRYKKSQEH